MWPFIQSFLLFVLLSSHGFAEQWVDPMEPPAYAKFKLQQKKIKITSSVKTENKTVGKESWVLQSILYAPSRKIAIINGKALSIGGRIDGAKIIYISKDKVKLLKKGKVIVLRVNPVQSTIKITQKVIKK